jgi:hypothetical protein
MGTSVTACICCDSKELISSPAIWMPFVADRAMGKPPLSIDASWGLQTIPEGTGYSTCKSLHCQACGHLFADYRFSEAEMQNLYIDYRGDEYTRLRDSYEPGYSQKNQGLTQGMGYKPQVESFLAPFLPEAAIRILDWGGDTGANTPFENRRQCLDIYDPSNKPLQQGNALTSKQTSNTYYDLVVLSEVLEHIPFPDQTIREVLPYMTSTTILYIEFPFERLQRNWDGNTCLAAQKKHWHEHVNFFTRISSRLLFERCGLTIIAENTLGLSDNLQPSPANENVIFMFACKLSTSNNTFASN